MGTFCDLLIQTTSEVVQSLNKARDLYEEWSSVQPSIAPNSRYEFDRITTELRNGLRSIEWDLEDLEEAVRVVVDNPKKFKFDANEIRGRKEFIQTTREEVELMKQAVLEVTGKTTPVGQTPARQTVASLFPPSDHGSSSGSFPSSQYQGNEPADVDIGHRGQINDVDIGHRGQINDVDIGHRTRMNGNMFIRKTPNNVSHLVSVNHGEDELTVSMMDEFDDSGDVLVVTDSRLDYFCHRYRSLFRSLFRSQSNRCILLTIIAVIILITILMTALILH